MEEAESIVCDTDVLIEYLDRGNIDVAKKLLLLGMENLLISSVTASELIVGAQDKDHFDRLIKFVSKIKILPITIEVSNTHFELVKQFSLSHRIQVQDALIAATVINSRYKLYTLNTSDFKFIPGLELVL